MFTRSSTFLPPARYIPSIAKHLLRSAASTITTHSLWNTWVLWNCSSIYRHRGFGHEGTTGGLWNRPRRQTWDDGRLRRDHWLMSSVRWTGQMTNPPEIQNKYLGSRMISMATLDVIWTPATNKTVHQAYWINFGFTSDPTMTVFTVRTTTKSGQL